MSASPSIPQPSELRSPASLGVTRLFLIFISALLLVLALNGGLAYLAMRKVQFDAIAAAAVSVSHDWALRIQGAIRFGKPLEQFYGLDRTLAEIRQDLPDVSSIVVTDAQGKTIQAQGKPVDEKDLRRAVQQRLASNSQAAQTINKRNYLVFPIKGRDGASIGTLTTIVDNEVVSAALSEHLAKNLQVLAGVTLASAVLLVLGTLFNEARYRDKPDTPQWRLQILPIAIVVLAQGVYSWQSIETFQRQYIWAVKQTAQISLKRLDRDLERLLDKGIQIDRLVGIEHPFGRVMEAVKEIEFMEVRAEDGRTLYRVDRSGQLVQDAAPVAIAQDYDALSELSVSREGQPRTVGSLRVHLNPNTIAAEARQRLFDSGTIVLVSVLFLVELLVVLTVLVKQRPDAPDSGRKRQSVSERYRHVLGRPCAFLLLFAWALPLSFISLRMREIYTPIAGLPEHVVLALPISTDMMFALISALLAGAIMDRRGWHLPFIAGVVICIAGAVLSSLAYSSWTFIGARAVVGAGYGLAWMGIQGYVFQWALPETRARGLAHLVAGIFAGHICGSAVGAMLAQQLGYTTVFALSGVLSVLPALFVILIMRGFFGKPDLPAQAVAPEPALAPAASASVFRLLRDRNFAWLQFGSVIPFSIAQVGLLYFTLPLFLADKGVSQATIGRIMMIYGLAVIYLGPLLGRYVDASTNKKPFIVMGGLVGSSGMIYLFFDNSLFAITLSVFALGMASALGGSAQSSFALSLKSVQEMGSGKAMGIQRAADKLGQMIGPLLIGALFASVGAASGLAITGLIYLFATLLFLLLTRVPASTPSAQR